MWIVIAIVIALAIVAIAALISGYTAFGKSPRGERLAALRQSPQWNDDRFHNAQPMWTNTRGALMQTFASTPSDVPDAPVPVTHSDFSRPPASGLRVTWFGHSSTLIEIDGTNILTDPIWSERSSPISWIGPKRWYDPPATLQQLPRIDAVVISHDHYDHLDHATIAALAATPALFLVPLGVGSHLEHWGIARERIIELDWWQSTKVNQLTIVATPARHASGRLYPQSDVTLWAGYALLGTSHRVYYSGDTGLLPAIAEIGERFGPFDVTLIESGQYDADWPDWHLGPEQAVEAHRMARGKVMIPVHWALFKLAHHSWTEPAERVLAAAQCHGVDVLIPRPGESIEPAHATLARWWPSLPWRTAKERPVIATTNGDPAQRFPSHACPE